LLSKGEKPASYEKVAQHMHTEFLNERLGDGKDSGIFRHLALEAL
jgi:hypothetical protein